MVRVVSVTVSDEGANPLSGIPHDTTHTLWHDWQGPEPLKGLKKGQDGATADKEAKQDGEKAEEEEEKEVFR